MHKHIQFPNTGMVERKNRENTLFQYSGLLFILFGAAKLEYTPKNMSLQSPLVSKHLHLVMMLLCLLLSGPRDTH